MSKLAILLYQSVHGKGVYCGNWKGEHLEVFYTAFSQGRNHMVPSKCCLSHIEKACDFSGGRSIFELTDRELILHFEEN